MRFAFSFQLLSFFLSACVAQEGEPSRRVSSSAKVFAVEVSTPRVLEGLPVGEPDISGRPTVTPCTTCHGADAGVLPETEVNLGGPHAGLRMDHGALACAACHASGAREKLHLADGRVIALTDAMMLCAQCHGPQKRDFDHGAHGGMRGYWDLSRGPRTRNHCVSCHDPHAPAFGVFMPMPAPRDRFTAPSEKGTP